MMNSEFDISESERMKFAEECKNDEERFSAVNDLEQEFAYLSSSKDEDLYQKIYPKSILPELLPDCLFDSIQEDCDIEEFSLNGEGKETEPCPIIQKQEKKWLKNLSNVWEKIKFHGINHGK